MPAGGVDNSGTALLRRRARRVGLIYVDGLEAGISRRRKGNGFVYRTQTNRILKSQRVLKRIERLVIVCRSSYVHPELLLAAEREEICELASRLPKRARRQMTLGETRFLALLKEFA